MDAFLVELAKGAPPGEALRTARREIRRRGFDNPFYWSAFILMGS